MPSQWYGQAVIENCQYVHDSEKQCVASQLYGQHVRGLCQCMVDTAKQGVLYAETGSTFWLEAPTLNWTKANNLSLVCSHDIEACESLLETYFMQVCATSFLPNINLLTVMFVSWQCALSVNVTDIISVCMTLYAISCCCHWHTATTVSQSADQLQMHPCA